jgi:hypothetical protein
MWNILINFWTDFEDYLAQKIFKKIQILKSFPILIKAQRGCTFNA